MKSLLILRHAKSSWGNATLGDFERPLNERGQEDAPRMGQLLKQHELTPHLIISSSAERALTTAEAVALASGYEAKIEVTRKLYLAGPEMYLQILRQMGGSHERVMVVGHNPGVEELVELLTGEFSRMSTAALAHVSLPISQWTALREGVRGKLLSVWTPRNGED